MQLQLHWHYPWLTADQIQQLTARLDTGVGSTKEAIAWVEQQFGLDYTESWMLKLLKRLDYRYKKPAQVPSKADAEAQGSGWSATPQKMGTEGPRQSLFCRRRPSAA